MKKVVRSLATVALMFVVATSTAKEPTLNVSPNASKSLVFEMDTDSRDTKVSIADLEGNIIFFENIKGVEAYTKKFDLGKLPDGSYFLIVENALKSISYSIDLNASDIKIIDRKENTKPVFRKNGDRVFLNLLNLDKKDVNITVFDSEGRIVFEETVADTMLVEKAFNFEKAYSDTYTVVVKDGDNSYYEDVLVK